MRRATVPVGRAINGAVTNGATNNGAASKSRDTGSNGPSAGSAKAPSAGATPLRRLSGTKIEPSALWIRVRKRLWAAVGEDVFNSWFGRLELEEICDDLAHMSVPTRFLCSWIQSNYHERILEAFGAETECIKHLHFTVRINGQPRPRVNQPAPAVASEPKTSMRTRNHRSPALGGDGLFGSSLDPKMTFDSFVAGHGNEMALAAARQVAHAAAHNTVAFNPLYIHASVGLGKSHLLNAIAWAAGANDRARNIVYLTADHFMYHFVSAVQRQSAIGFKEWLRRIDLLLIDDMQFLQGKSAVAEFGHTLNALLTGAKQIVVVGDTAPNGLELLDERLRSRLSGGLVVPILGFDAELRRAIIDKRAENAIRRFPGLYFPPAVLDFIARKIVSHGRDLDGAINRLVAANQLTGEPIAIETAEKALVDLMRTRENRRVKIDDIQIAVARHFKVSKPDLLSARRSRSVVRPRQIAMYLAKMLTSRSLPEIGRRFGNRDHTTVLHAVRKIEQLMSEDIVFAQEVELLKRMIEE
ncbi:MAG: chromosomal replication initiator protein DnaA [Alphaproteobacteria bacterium]|nr:chromosomal replication initiator protein DnaA [Alphaproteobacteria bacterium]